MWVLVIMLAIPGLGLQSEQVLARFTSITACMAERNRIGFAMAEAYPETADEFHIACLYRGPAGRKWKA